MVKEEMSEDLDIEDELEEEVEEQTNSKPKEDGLSSQEILDAAKGHISRALNILNLLG